MAGRPPVGEQRGPSSRIRTHCGMEKRPAWGARSSRGRTVGLSSPLSSRLLQTSPLVLARLTHSPPLPIFSSVVCVPSICRDCGKQMYVGSCSTLSLEVEMLVLFETPTGFAVFKVLNKGKLDKIKDLWKEFTTSDSARKRKSAKAVYLNEQESVVCS
ncbi:unnamed protein product [Triticum turgidum subsp. durum]|uniref:Nucleolar protein 58/56 N-terminal domain-containing protein n=1 Tax=Triticum turgidum subsp. durum TaxID=4567 RepID=A0A9R0TZ19_TRITD|nr:unnamed protein product [Triticum turgidum subsp. durum]